MVYDRKLPAEALDVGLIKELAKMRKTTFFWCLACLCRFVRNESAMEEAGVILPKFLCESCAETNDEQVVLARFRSAISEYCRRKQG